jgi:hypothetical protein
VVFLIPTNWLANRQGLVRRQIPNRSGQGLSLPPGFLSEIVSGKKPLPHKHRATLASLCHAWLMQLNEKKTSVESIEWEWRDRM